MDSTWLRWTISDDRARIGHIPLRDKLVWVDGWAREHLCLGTASKLVRKPNGTDWARLRERHRVGLSLLEAASKSLG